MNKQEFIDYASEKYDKVTELDGLISILHLSQGGVISPYCQDKVIDDIKATTGLKSQDIKVEIGKKVIEETTFSFQFPNKGKTPEIV
jgi:hypothetical protein